MRAAVCTAASGPHLELFDVTGPALARYAERNGYELVVVHDRLSPRPPAWDKVLLLHELVGRFDAVMWVDADATVLDAAPDFRAVLTGPRPVHVAWHRVGRFAVPNTGVIALRGGDRSARFLERLWRQRRYIDHRWWENAALLHMLGYRPLPRAGMVPVVPSMSRALVARLDGAWNSIPDDPAPAPYIVHVPGVPLAERLAVLASAASS